MDPLSDVLSLLRLRSYVSGGFDAAGDWAVQFGPYQGIKFHAVITGACWISVADVPDALHIDAGECFLLPRGKPFRISSHPSVDPVDIRSLLPPVADGRIVTHNGGGEFLSIGCQFTLADGQADLLLDLLPPILHIPQQKSSETLRWCINGMRRELSEIQPGAFVIAQTLATMVLVHALRLYLSSAQRQETGWLFALSHRQLRAAISAMHRSPGERWSLQSLAREAGMSRTAFALRFKDVVGLSPMEYLTRWRMMQAAHRLTTTRQSISEIGSAVGYDSDKSFSTAFKRVMKCPPRQYARRSDRRELP